MFRWLFPVRCPFCGAILREGYVCPACVAQLARPTERLLREKTLSAGVDGLSAAFLYEGKARQALHAFKFRNKPEYARAFAQEMAVLVTGSFDVVAFAPMRYYSKNQRGYNQAELLARQTARLLRLPCRPLLHKIRVTRHQHELTAEEREKNLRGAFEAVETLDGERVLLVDDIVTTGATMRELAECLREAGASKVCGLAFAVTP